MGRPILLLWALLVALLGALAATALLVQPPPVRTSPEAGEFNSVRAKARLAMVLGNERPHPADSAASDAVRARLLGQIRAIGLTPIVRDQFVCNELYKRRGVSCARVRNVIVNLGAASGQAILLNTHYDSSPVGPGAGDAGAGVATLLEVASILRSGRLQRPLILLFNEGEELGLIGARAFLSDPLSRRVGSLINLEARGTTGPVTMFETSLPNGPPVRAFARAVDRPYANSLATDFYRQLPNYTDVNTFSERGWLALNFAMIGNETRYHSAGDNLAALDPRSLQHMGDQTLAVTRELASSTPSGNGNLLFADVAGRQLVLVPQWLGFAVLGLLVAGFAWLSWRRGGTWRGLVIVLGSLLASAGIAWLGMFVLGQLRPGSFWRAYPVWTHLAVYSSGLVAAVVALVLLGRRLTVPQLRASFWLGFLLLGAAVLAIAPAGVIYFLFPPLLALIGILLSPRLASAEQAGSIAAAVLLWLMLGEMLALLTELLNNGPMFVFAPLALLIAMPWLIEAKRLLDASGRARAIGSAALVMLLGWTATAAAPAYSVDRQQRFTIQYVRDSGEGKSWWAVANDGKPLPDAFGNGWAREELPHTTGKQWVRPAPDLAQAAAPGIEVVGRARAGSDRAVRLRLHLQGNDRIALIAPKDAEIRAAGTAQHLRPISAKAKDGRYVISCSGRSCDGSELVIVTSKPSPIELLVAGLRFALPPQAQPLVSARPANARPQSTPDQTVALVRLNI
ncbi:MAG: M28 family peptidase [Sphingomicrobium sp.]